MREQTKSQRVLKVHALDGDEVSGDLRSAFPEADAMVVHGELLRVVSERTETLGLETSKVLNGHLENFGFFEFGRCLLFKGGRHKSTELVQAIVNTVATLLLDRL